MLAALALATSAQGAELSLPEGPDRALVYAKCRTCHDLQYVIESKGMSESGWDGLLSDMEGYGVQLTDDEYRRILTYLSTYMGDKPPPAPAAGAEPSAREVNGGEVFAENCTSCHQENAEGVEGTFPPLANNADLFITADFPARVVLFGMSGTITVNGKSYEGEMPPFDHLSDAEIAAVVNWLRSHFGNDPSAHPGIPELTPEAVAALRKEPMEPEEVFAFRDAHR